MREDGCDRMIEITSRLDGDDSWPAYTSRWSSLEVARALKKDGEPKELIELDLRELRTHRVNYRPVSHGILEDAASI